MAPRQVLKRVGAAPCGPASTDFLCGLNTAVAYAVTFVAGAGAVGYYASGKKWWGGLGGAAVGLVVERTTPVQNVLYDASQANPWLG